MVWDNMIPKKGVSYEKEINTDLVEDIFNKAVVNW